jgi:hypothetical protein
MAVALAIVGGLISAVGSVAQGAAAARAANFNAAVANQNAKIAQDQGYENEAQQRRLNARKLSAANANIGVSGVTAEGSPLDVLGEVASAGEYDAQQIRYGAAIKSLNYRTQAQQYKEEAKSSMTAGFIGAASSLIGGASSAYGKSISVS